MGDFVNIHNDAAGAGAQKKPLSEFYTAQNPQTITTPTLAAVLTAGAAAGSKAITGLLDPTNAQDADTKAARDAAIAAAIAALPTATPAATVEYWASDGNFAVTATDRDVEVIATASSISNGRNFSLYTGAPAGRRVRVTLSATAQGLANLNHINLTGTGVTYKYTKSDSTIATCTTLEAGSNVSANSGNAVFEFISRGSNEWHGVIIACGFNAGGAPQKIYFT
jgi:hypothetical protein